LRSRRQRSAFPRPWHGAVEEGQNSPRRNAHAILGAEILLGFQFRGTFSDGFDQLPTDVRYLEGLALGLMVCVVGLLITPGPHHRIVEGGADSGHLHRGLTVIAELALLGSHWASIFSSRPAASSVRPEVQALEPRPRRWQSRLVWK
jgi:hypothetical protein